MANNTNFDKEFSQIVAEIKEILTPSRKQTQDAIANIITEIKTYFINARLETAVIGLSGGLDSSVCAALFKMAGIKTIGVSIPINNTNTHMDFARAIGELYCDEYFEIDSYYPAVIEMKKTIDSKFINESKYRQSDVTDKIREGNIRARFRMITLYDIARMTNGLVVSTDNLSESKLGFWTICGDVGDFGPIQNIWKGLELPFVAQELAIPSEIISQAPSDGLNVTEQNTDEAQLGASYVEVDVIMSWYLSSLPEYPNRTKHREWFERNKNEEKIKNILYRFTSTEFKRRGTYNVPRNTIWK